MHPRVLEAELVRIHLYKRATRPTRENHQPPRRLSRLRDCITVAVTPPTESRYVSGSLASREIPSKPTSTKVPGALLGSVTTTRCNKTRYVTCASSVFRYEIFERIVGVPRLVQRHSSPTRPKFVAFRWLLSVGSEFLHGKRRAIPRGPVFSPRVSLQHARHGASCVQARKRVSLE